MSETPNKASSEEDQFQDWLANINDSLKDFRARLPAEVCERLDGSPASLDVLEAWLLNRYPTVSAIMSDDELSNLDGATCYVGEVFRKALGGHWRIRLDDPNYAFHGIPEVSFLKKKDTPVCPMSLVAACLDRRTGKYLSLVFNGSKKLIERNRPPR